ncbi:MAG: aminotransferase class III-fold pyridoxal phosphate-dependent enzyme, partial [Luminiphilus sp.]
MAGELLQRRHRLLGQHAPLFYEEPLEIVSGEGVWLTSADGRRYLDVYNNVPSCGHCHPHIIAALTGQASRLNVHTRYLHNTILDYVERLTALFDPSLDMAMLTCSGSEANELALRMVRHMTGHQGIIVTDGAYHGNTEAVAELGTGFMPEAQGCQRVVGIPAPDSYRLPPGVTTESAEDYYVAQVESAIEILQSRGMGVAGILLCPEFANEGLLNAPEGFIDRAVAAVRAAGGLYIADEVQG